MVSVEKLEWHPDPFQSGKSFGAILIVKLSTSATLWSRYLAAQRWSPCSIPRHGPI